LPPELEPPAVQRLAEVTEAGAVAPQLRSELQTRSLAQPSVPAAAPLSRAAPTSAANARVTRVPTRQLAPLTETKHAPRLTVAAPFWLAVASSAYSPEALREFGEQALPTPLREKAFQS
jgi:hypothetical protein